MIELVPGHVSDTLKFVYARPNIHGIPRSSFKKTKVTPALAAKPVGKPAMPVPKPKSFLLSSGCGTPVAVTVNLDVVKDIVQLSRVVGHLSHKDRMAHLVHSDSGVIKCKMPGCRILFTTNKHVEMHYKRMHSGAYREFQRLVDGVPLVPASSGALAAPSTAAPLRLAGQGTIQAAFRRQSAITGEDGEVITILSTLHFCRMALVL